MCRILFTVNSCTAYLHALVLVGLRGGAVKQPIYLSGSLLFFLHIFRVIF